MLNQRTMARATVTDQGEVQLSLNRALSRLCAMALSAAALALADQLESESAASLVAASGPAQCDLGEVVYGVFERRKGKSSDPAAPAVNATP